MEDGSRDEGERPLVSIIIPSYNQGRFLRETLDSVFAQDYRPLEVVVVDGASTDETVQVLEEYERAHSELRWSSEPDNGLPDAVNKGLFRARGTYAGIQSSDDLYRPGAIREAVEVLQRDPTLGLVYANADIIDEEGNFVVLAPNRLPFSKARFLARSTIIHQSSAFFVLRIAQELGGWRDEYYCADSELWLRMMFRTRVQHVDRVWSAWRKHESQRDKNARAMWDDWGRMVSESPDVARAPLPVRLAARAGRRLIAIDYNPTDSHGFRVQQMWRAIATYPPSQAAIYDKRLLLPGWRPIAHYARRRWRETVRAAGR